MKTFDDAFLKVFQDGHLAAMNTLAFSDETFENDLFKELIALCAMRIIEEMVKVDTEPRVCAVMCSGLQKVFQSGMLVGMEMEKP